MSLFRAGLRIAIMNPKIALSVMFIYIKRRGPMEMLDLRVVIACYAGLNRNTSLSFIKYASLLNRIKEMILPSILYQIFCVVFLKHILGSVIHLEIL